MTAVISSGPVGVTFANRTGILVAPEIAERPPEERVGFRRRTYRNGGAIVGHGFVEPSFHLRLVATPKVLLRLFR